MKDKTCNARAWPWCKKALDDVVYPRDTIFGCQLTVAFAQPRWGHDRIVPKPSSPDFHPSESSPIRNVQKVKVLLKEGQAGVSGVVEGQSESHRCFKQLPRNSPPLPTSTLKEMLAIGICFASLTIKQDTGSPQ
jgi:hypothetical protein